MTNYGRDPLESLWKEILDLHWNYLEMDESLKKIEERKKLEGRLREYISIVPHDRKFFLAETEHVLRASITHMRDFSAYKSAIGFESISQYANNLFMKPWRKEYRVIKMYSGFYQHEIKNNLLDAERIFIAMGYKLLPNQTLVLDGPICPDQVTNVSRDALTAYVECQIMKQVNSELTQTGLQTTWNEIFNFRECHIGDSSQTIKGLSQIIQSHIHMHSMMRKGGHDYYQPTDHHYYQQPMMQLPTPVSEYYQPYPQQPRNLIDEEVMHQRVEMKPEIKLRSSLKKSTHSTSDSLDMEAELNELRTLKREKSSTPASTCSDVKTRDGIGNYQAWDYVFQNLEKDNDRKKIITADEKIAAELESLKITPNGHGPPRDRHSKSNTQKATNAQSQNTTKHRTKSVSVSTTTDPSLGSHEHKRTSSVSVNENNHRIQMPKPPELLVGKDEWSCRFCTFINPNSKKICEMCSKSKDFFHDNEKSSTATCV